MSPASGARTTPTWARSTPSRRGRDRGIGPHSPAAACRSGARPSLAETASLTATESLAALGSGPGGLAADEARRRLEQVGPNALRTHGARAWQVLARQLRNPILLLLLAAVLASLFVGQGTDAGILLAIIALSVGLGFVDEYRSERAVAALHAQIRHVATVMRGGRATSLDVTGLVPGDVVLVEIGDVIPADLRLLETTRLECDEAVLTGESMPAAKTADAQPPGRGELDLPSCAFMGTVVRAGSGRGVVVSTGASTLFGRIAMRLGERLPLTAFQHGLSDFSAMLARLALGLAGSILLINVALGRSLLSSALFALAIAVGLAPQLLPAIVTISLSRGARRLAQAKVVVKRLVSIEDLGNVNVLFTDKTGTLTQGRISFAAAVSADDTRSEDVLRLGLLCNEAVLEDGRPVGGNQLDRALWEAPAAARVAHDGAERLASAPFDYDRRLMSTLMSEATGRRLVTKGAPEAVLDRCSEPGEAARRTLAALFASGARVVAVATRELPRAEAIGPDDERDLRLAGFLCFRDPPKDDAREALRRLAGLGVTVKVLTGDNGAVAEHLCADLGLPLAGTLNGTDLADLSDDRLRTAVATTTIFARVSPEQKARILRAQRGGDSTVGFLGDGVNDAVALHEADVGISVDSGSDVVKDAADIVLVTKSLDLLADAVTDGRRIFANTIKYVLMATSSNFGNMFSAAGASLLLGFLPMLPTQILLNNFLYDVSELTIPTDRVDPEALRRPAHWDLGFIRRFMRVFGPISSAFDFCTFGVMLWGFHASHTLFRSGWFVESLATQTLVIFVIRTRRVPFVRSRPSRPLLVTTLACAGIGALLPFTPLASTLGFTPLPAAFFAILVVLVLAYLALVEQAKRRFYRARGPGRPLARPRTHRHRRMHRLVTRWSIPS